MNKCDKFHAQIAEGLYGKLGAEEEAALEAHLAECSSCASEYKDMAMTLKVMNKRERSDPGPEFWDGYWDRLEKRLDGGQPAESGSKVGRRGWAGIFGVLPNWAWQGAAAVALIVIGILIGTTLLRPPAVQVAKTPPFTATPGIGQASDSTRRAQNYFDRSKLILLGLVNYDPRTQDSYGLDFPAQKKLSRELVNEAGGLKNDLKAPAQKRLRELVGDLETILVQIANLESANDFEAVEFVKQGVDRKGIFLKINLAEMGPSPKARPDKSSI